jgi:cellulose synthase operon protein C
MKRLQLHRQTFLVAALWLGPCIFGYAQTQQPVVSSEIKMMQEVEPGFIPKDDRAIQLFLLQRAVAETENAIKKKQDLAHTTRELFSRKFREDLAHFTGIRATPLEAKINDYIDEAITYYEIALKNNPDNKNYAADALYNLGRFYFERDEKDYFDKLARYNLAREQGRDDVPYPDEDFHRTIDAYEKLLETYPDFKQLDSVYYLLGLAFWYEGAFNQAVDRFQDLIKRYPESRYVEEVWFRLGEFFYDMDEYDNAIQAYEKVANNPKSKLYDKALYKIAWSHYQKDRFMKAVDYFIKILALTYSETGEGAASGMRAEVTRYIVKSFSEKLLEDEGRPKLKTVKKSSEKPKLSDTEKEYAERLGLKLASRISKYFLAQNNPPYIRDILIETASQLLDESKIDGAVLAFEKSIELDPNHPDNPKFASQIVDILQEADRLEEARERNHAIIKQYGKNSSWYKAQANNYDAQKLAREAVRDAILALAVYYHKTGKDQKAANDKNADANLKQAAKLYAAYVREYPEREDTHKAIFYFAESAFELNRFRIALDAYQLLKDYPLPMPDNIRRDATLNIVFTFRHVLEGEAKEQRFKEVDFDSLTSKQRGSEPEEIPELGKKYLAAIDEFLKLAPTDEQVPVLLFHAAAIFYVYGQSDEALSRFHYIVDTYPQTTAALVASRLIIDDAVSKEQWARVIELSRRFAALDLGGQKGDFSKIEGNARFKIARAVFEEANELTKNNQLTEAKAKYKESAELFAKLLEEDPKNPYADVMLFNSARAIVQSGTVTLALPLYKRLYTEYPESEYAKTARFQEALALEKMLKFADAAKAYDGIIKEDPKSESAGDAMLNKALLYEAAGDSVNATIAFVDFAKRYPEREEAPDALLSAASIYKKTGKVTQAIAMLEQFIKQYGKDAAKTASIIEAHVQIADIYGELEKSAGSANLKRYSKERHDNYKKAVLLYSNELASATAAFFAAKAQLILEKPEQESFKTMTINARLGKAQAEQLTAMMKKLTELSAKNEAVIRTYAQPVWNAESMRRIGALYEHLAKAMIKAPCPRDVEVIDEFACDEYTVLLEDKAAVLEEKALSAYKQAYEIAMSAYDSPPDLVNGILSGLNRLRPGEYQRVGNLIDKPEVGGVFGDGRMLSTGRMASSLHEQEVDPDKKPVAKKEPKEAVTPPTNIEEKTELPAAPEGGNQGLEEDFE